MVHPPSKQVGAPCEPSHRGREISHVTSLRLSPCACYRYRSRFSKPGKTLRETKKSIATRAATYPARIAQRRLAPYTWWRLRKTKTVNPWKRSEAASKEVNVLVMRSSCAVFLTITRRSIGQATTLCLPLALRSVRRPAHLRRAPALREQQHPAPHVQGSGRGRKMGRHNFNVPLC